MTSMQEQAIAKLKEQQAGVQERSPQWMVAEQLMEICEAEPESAELIAQDLDNGMNITEAEKKIKAFADKHKANNFACVTPREADRILREYFGLPERPARESIVIPFPGRKEQRPVPDPAPVPPAPVGGVHVDLAAYLGG